MRACIPSISARLGLNLGLLLAVCAAAPAVSSASSHGPKYALEIVEGESTLPEYSQVAATSGSVESGPSQEVAVSIIRNGVTVYRDVETGGGAWLAQVPAAGEVVTLESPVGTLIGSVVYDGLPTLDPTVCAGSANFSGQNSAGDTVHGIYFTQMATHDPYGRFTGVHTQVLGKAQVKSLTGTSFGGEFLSPLTIGETAGVIESIETQLANEATYTYTSEFERPVGACPVPPPPPAPPPPPVLSGSIFKLIRTTVRKLLRFGWSDQVAINQPGTVTQDLYLDSGKLPAYAAASKRHRHGKSEPPALLLARGSASASQAGTVKVSFKLTARGRRKLKQLPKAKVVLMTTLTTASGQKLTLGRRTLSLHL